MEAVTPVVPKSSSLTTPEDPNAANLDLEKTGKCLGVEKGLVYLSEINSALYCCS